MEDQDLQKTISEKIKQYFLTSHKIICDSTNNTPDIMSRNELRITIRPDNTSELITYLSEDFDQETAEKPSLLLFKDSGIDK